MYYNQNITYEAPSGGTIYTKTGKIIEPNKHKPHRLPSAMANAGGGWDLERRLA